LEGGGASGNFNRDIEVTAIPQKNIALENFGNIAQRLGYFGDLSDPVAIHKFVEDDLTRKLGVQSNNIRKEPFGDTNSRIVRKVNAAKKPSKVTYKCGNCGKIGHKKNTCTKGRRTRKANYASINQSNIENLYDQEDETIEILEDDEDSSEDEENTEEEKEIIPDTQQCFNVKKKPRFL
jgi:hypothetical protein